MTPKEKAQELIQKHLDIYDIEAIAIPSALISVEECLGTCVESMIYYWVEVKHEIEKL